jgi:hypothetical protein
MAHKIWGVDLGLPVETSGGGNINGEYSGFHKPQSATQIGGLRHLSGSAAQRQVDAAERLRLNDGESFRGTLVNRRVDHVSLYIGTHPIHGLSAYIDRPTSHAGATIEIVTDKSDAPVTLHKTNFFSQLLEEDVPKDLLDEFCKKFWRT